MLTRRIVGEVGELEGLRPEWEALLARSAADEPALAPDWILTWWKVFGDEGGRALRVLTLWQGRELVGLVPLLSRVVSYPPGIPFRRLELLASGEPEDDEICSEYVGIIAARDAESAVAESFADAASRGELGPWSEILLPAMDGDRELVSMVKEAFECRGANVSVASGTGAPYVPLAGSWEAYLQALGSRRRYFVRKSLRAFEAWAGAAPALTIATTRVELDRARKTLLRLHAERWAAADRRGVFESSRFREFHDRMMPQLLDRGALQLGSLDVQGEPVAAFYNLVWNGKTYFYQSGRRTDVPAHLRPGIVMHACLIRHAIEQGQREYDFLAGMARYKLDLALEVRDVISLRIARPSLAEATRRAAEYVIGRARSLRRTAITTSSRPSR